jgi:hypothetical protein
MEKVREEQEAAVRDLREKLVERGLVIDALLRHAKGEYPRRRNPRTGRLAWEYNIRRDEKRQEGKT